MELSDRFEKQTQQYVRNQILYENRFEREIEIEYGIVPIKTYSHVECPLFSPKADVKEHPFRLSPNVCFRP